MAPRRILLSTASLALVLVANLPAQGLAPAAPKAPVAAPFAVTPLPARLAAPSASAIVASELVRDVRLPAAARAGRGQATTLMIVGGAGIVTGLLLDQGVITLIGAGVWLYGLYLYLR